jgi:hypothetical protein
MTDSTERKRMLPAPVILLAVVPLFIWRMYSRVQRLTTRQRSKIWRHRTTLGFFPLLLLVLGYFAVKTNPVALAGMAAGLVAGGLLGHVAIGRTQFEQQGEEFYFKPFAPIGIAMAALVVGRMGWRAYELFTTGVNDHHQFLASPLTLVIFGTLAGYYMSFALGLLAWRNRTAPQASPAPSAPIAQ